MPKTLNLCIHTLIAEDQRKRKYLTRNQKTKTKIPTYLLRNKDMDYSGLLIRNQVGKKRMEGNI